MSDKGVQLVTVLTSLISSYSWHLIFAAGAHHVRNGQFVGFAVIYKTIAGTPLIPAICYRQV